MVCHTWRTVPQAAGDLCDPGLQRQQQKGPKFSGALHTEKEVLLLLLVLDISQARSRNKTKTKVLFPWQDSAPRQPSFDCIKISINSFRVDRLCDRNTKDLPAEDATKSTKVIHGKPCLETGTYFLIIINSVSSIKLL